MRLPAAFPGFRETPFIEMSLHELTQHVFSLLPTFAAFLPSTVNWNRTTAHIADRQGVRCPSTLVDDPSSPEPSKGGLLSDHGSFSATVLIADDNLANLELLSEILQAEGHRAICVMDGEQALKALRF